MSPSRQRAFATIANPHPGAIFNGIKDHGCGKGEFRIEAINRDGSDATHVIAHKHPLAQDFGACATNANRQNAGTMVSNDDFIPHAF